MVINDYSETEITWSPIVLKNEFLFTPSSYEINLKVSALNMYFF